MMRSFAPAKVNLYLHVTGKRPDGYHLLDSLAVFPAVGDWLDYVPDDQLSLALSGPFAAGLGADHSNLVLRAARALADRTGHPLTGRLVLEKNLPLASGIGGGSADAAACLRLLRAAWGKTMGLEALALELGADVPVCLERRTQRMAGIGEQLSPPPRLPEFGIVLANPGFPVATAQIFRHRPAGFSEPARLPDFWPDAAAMAATLAALNNDLEATAIEMAPGIADVLAGLRALPGCLLARMSGSGATCFALFPTPEAARVAALQNNPGWWSWGGGLYESGVVDL